jgi:uncharacterized protein (TIGR02271 family)
MKQTVVGVFDKYATAQHAAQELRSSGFADSVFVTEEPGEDVTRQGENQGVFDHVRSFFAELFGTDEDREVRTYAEAVRRGGALVKVEVDEQQADVARSALESAGAVDIEERAREWRASGWDADLAETAAPADVRPSRAAEVRTGGQEDVIPVVQEELQVGKRTVQTGVVRVYAHTVETPVNESVSLRSEHAEVERRPVDRPATEQDLAALRDRTIEVRETAEQPVVAKTARVVEEVSVGKTVSERTQEVSDTLRSTQVEVDRGESSATGLQSLDERDSEFRRHFQTSYAGERYEDYEPAYLYGHELSSDERYRGRSWTEMEPDVRRDWESRYPGSAWERFKAAVRHGWERIAH